MSAPVLAAAALLPVLALAQQQTGASGGIPVAPPPVVAESSSRPAPVATAVFRVRVLDGRDGAPLQGAHLAVWYDEAEGAGTLLTTDAAGTAALPAPLGQPVRVLVTFDALVDCRKAGDSPASTGFNLQALTVHGQSADNRCGSVATHAKPGELVLFARKPRWYEGINHNQQR